MDMNSAMYMAFDIETDGLFTDESIQPPQVTCVVTMIMRRITKGSFVIETPRRWHAALDTATCMSIEEICVLVDYMWSNFEKGVKPLSWNGLGFDFRVLHAHVAAHSSLHLYNAKIKNLALDGIDPMFNFFMNKGFPVALFRVACGFELALNKSGSGGDAAALWFSGTETDRHGIVNYCERDVAVMCMVVSAIDNADQIKWITKSSNRLASWTPSDAQRLFMSCRDACRLRQPDNRWMQSSDPSKDVPTKKKFVAWL
jgi:hypothetical protein